MESRSDSLAVPSNSTSASVWTRHPAHFHHGEAPRGEETDGDYHLFPMELRFYLDPETGEAHILRHGVSEHEVAEVLRNSGEDRPGREGSRVALGATEAGRFLRVIYAPDPGRRSAFVITA